MGSESLIDHHRHGQTHCGNYVSYESVEKPDCDEKPSAPMDDPNQTAEIYRKYTMNDEDDESTSDANGCCGRLCSSCKGCLFTVFECLFLIF